MSHAWGGNTAWDGFLTAQQIVALGSPDLPSTVQALNRIAATWRHDDTKSRQAAGRGRSSWEYHLSVLPPGAQARAVLKHSASTPAAPTIERDGSNGLWVQYEALSKTQKDECQRRLDAIEAVERHQSAGLGRSAAVAMVAAEAGVSSATIFNWLKLTQGVARADRLAALAPEYRATASFAACHAKAWEVLLSDWLRPEAPRFSASYRRMRKAASANGWLPIPSERALRRRVDKEIPAGVITLAREGKDKAKQHFPAQRRTRATLSAMQAVNMDGHTFDVFVRFADGSIGRPCLVAIQDLYSGKFVGWRHAETENKVSVRLAIGDMVERFGIPDKMVIDNGRAFASKWITGGVKNRFRFKVREEEPQGLLTTLGVEIIWTRPYSGQSKPIERAFRDLCEEIAKHPFCAGAYTGNSPLAKPENYASRAIDFAAFQAFADEQIAEHNAMPGRRSETAAGSSFDETFAASLAQPTTIVRWPTAGQKALWLMAAEQVTARRGSGEIHFFGNRYWAEPLNELAGRKVTVRFDPDRLQEPIKVYGADDAFICEAQCIAPVGFFDAEGAQRDARNRKAMEKAQRDYLALHRKLSADELAAIYGRDQKPAASAPQPPKVARLATGGARPIPQPEPMVNFEEAFGRGLRLIASDE